MLSRLRSSGSGLRVEVHLGSQYSLLIRFRVQGSGFRVEGSGFWVQGSGFRVQGSGGFRVQGSGFRVQGGSGFRVQGSGFRVQGSGFRVQVQGLRPRSVQGHILALSVLYVPYSGLDSLICAIFWP